MFQAEQPSSHSTLIAVLLVGGILLVVAYLGGLFDTLLLSEEEKERIAIEQGLVKLIGGIVVSIHPEDNRFDIDVDPLGPEREIYSIYFNEKTEFFKEELVVNAENEANSQNEPLDTSQSAFLEDFDQFIEDQLRDDSIDSYVAVPLVFSDLQENITVDVHLIERVDLERAEKLLAERVQLAN